MYFIGCTNSPSPEWESKGFKEGYVENRWKNHGVYDANTAKTYDSCGIKPWEVGYSRDPNDRYLNSIAPKEKWSIFSSAEAACEWKSWANNEKKYTTPEMLQKFDKYKVSKDEAHQWLTLLKDFAYIPTSSTATFPVNKDGVTQPIILEKALSNNLTPDEATKWNKIFVLNPFNTYVEAGKWKKAGFNIIDITASFNQGMSYKKEFENFNQDDAKRYLDMGIPFKALWFGLNNNIDPILVNKLYIQNQIDYKYSVELLKYFTDEEAISVYNGIKYKLLKEYRYQEYIQKAFEVYRAGFKLDDVGLWLSIFEPKNDSDIWNAKTYYDLKISPSKAYSYSRNYVSASKALEIERKIQSACGNNISYSFMISTANPYELSGKCIEVSRLEQKVLLNQQNAIFQFGKNYIKVSDTSSIRTSLTGVIKINGTTNFKTPEGLTTVISTGKVIVSY